LSTASTADSSESESKITLSSNVVITIF
jgi:hypothetical protein